MLSGITVLEDDVEHAQVVEDEGVGTVGRHSGRVLAEGHLGHDRRDERAVVGDHVEHGVVGAIRHGVEEHFELDRAVGEGELLRGDGNESKVVDVVVLGDGAKVGERLGRIVGDRGGDVCEKAMVST